MRKPEKIVPGTLLDMLSYQRRAWSPGEAGFLHRYLTGYPQDTYGNFRIEVDPTNTKTLFSCHTDSVHPSSGLKQKIFVDEHLAEAFKVDKYALGADDAVGMWLMLHMIERGLPGVYVFHRAEEIGGCGSSWIEQNDEKFLQRFDRAVAFDRRGTTSVITHQGYRCCSDTFGNALARELAMGYGLDDTGTFTDTANYTEVIPECTNVSVGYNNEHSGSETQDLEHAEALRDAVMSVNWESLPTARDPAAPLPYANVSYFGGKYTPLEVVQTEIGNGFKSVDEAYQYAFDDPEGAAELLFAAYPDNGATYGTNVEVIEEDEAYWETWDKPSDDDYDDLTSEYNEMMDTHTDKL